MARPRGAKARAQEVYARLGVLFPGAAKEMCALSNDSPYQLIAATILSAQCTDERVNLVTPVLFARYPRVEDLAGADLEELQGIIRSTGFFRAKAQSLIGMANGVIDRFGGVVPGQMEDLVTLPGVGRKTANVVLSVAFDLPGLPVDTHVGRLSRRLGLTTETDPVKVEADLCALLDPSEWGAMSLRLILHGRRTCTARRPDCMNCVLASICPSAGLGGATPVRTRSCSAAPKKAVEATPRA